MSDSPIAKLRAILGSDGDVLSDELVCRAHREAQALSKMYISMGLDPKRIAELVMDARRTAQSNSKGKKH